MDFLEVAASTALILRSRKKRKRKVKNKPLIDPILNQMLLSGKFNKPFVKLRPHKEEFIDYFRMSVENFDKLLLAVEPRIGHQNTVLRMKVPLEDRLTVTLRFLATGDGFPTLHRECKLGVPTIREIVRDTCDAIWDCLLPAYMPTVADSEAWSKIADCFYERTTFPNCIGAVDVKHIKLRKKSSSGSNLSIILIAVADANYFFTAVETRPHSSRDCNLFKKSKFGRKFNNGELNIPSPKCLPNGDDGCPMPFVVVGGEAIAASENILRPYSNRTLLVDNRTFNCRLNQAIRMVEHCFGIMESNWHILHRPFGVNAGFCISIVKAVCMLHNFVRRNNGVRFEDLLYECTLESIQPVGSTGDVDGIKTRDYFAQYFTSFEGSVP